MSDPQMIPAKRWPTFFDEFSSSYVGKGVYVVEGDLMNEIPDDQYAPLQALTFEKHHFHHYIIAVSVAHSDGVKEYSLKRINLVWVVYDTYHNVTALEIIDNDGSKLTLNFASENDD
jgi:hypothetical protein